MNEKPTAIKQSDYFVPRPYQEPVIEAFRKGYKKILLTWPRRGGKDVTCTSILVEEALRVPAIYWYLWPSYAQGKKAIWNGQLADGKPFLSLIPKAYISNMNQTEMSIDFVNGSRIQILGTQDIDALRGVGPRGVVFSEYAKIHPMAFSVVYPAIQANKGWIIIESTPLGKNHFWDMYQIAEKNPKDWFSYRLTLDDTKHVDKKELEELISTGVYSEDWVQQEFYCSFDLGISGVVFGRALEAMYLEERITQVPWDTAHPVHTSWDIGNDTTAICFFQVIGQNVRVIDYYEKSSLQLDHYVKVVKDKPYIYSNHFFPHDMRITEWAGPRFTRLEKAKQLGLDGRVVDNVSLDDGIEWTRSTMSRVWIDQFKCKQLVRNLENYRYKKNENTMIYSKEPEHTWASHGADSFRYMCLSVPKVGTGMTPKDIDKIKESVFGSPNRMSLHDAGWQPY